MADKNVTIRVRARTQQAQASVRNLGVALRGAAQQGMAMRRTGFVSPEMSKQMSAFNERTERARQLMVAFGGTLGAAGGQATYYAGTILYIYGMFSKMQLVIMGGIGAIAALGKAMYDAASGPLNDMREGLKKAAEEAGQLADNLADSAEQAILSAAGWSKWDIKILGARRQLAEVTEHLTDLEAERNKLAIEAGWIGEAAAGKLDEELMAARAKKAALELAIGAAKMAHMIEKARAEIDRATGSTITAGGGGDREPLDVSQGRILSDYELLFGMLVPRGTTQQMVDEALQAMDYMRSAQMMSQINWDKERQDYHEREIQRIEQQIERQMQLNQARFDRELALEEKAYKAKEREAKDAANAQMEYARMGADATIAFARAMAAGNRAAIGEELKAMALQAAAKAAWHGIMAIAAGFFLDAAHATQHATLAALYGGFAATYGAVGAGLAAGGSGGGGGGGGAPAGGYAEHGYKPAREDEQEQQTVVINVQGSYFESSEAGRELWERQRAWEQQQTPGAMRGSF